MLTPLCFDRFPDHGELSALLHVWASQRPDLLTVHSIGKSWAGREIWMATLTSVRTGPPQDKPGFLVDANIHAAELTSSFAALHLIHHVLSGHRTDKQITRLLDQRVLYVIPRLCPDGAEAVMQEHRYVRSSVRPHPTPDREPGLHGADVDGDGRVLFMRYPDPNGPWKPCDQEERLLVPREPDEDGGDYYRLLLEGEIDDYDGATVPVAPDYYGLDLATNFHSDWSDLPQRSSTAGGFAGSEPEIQALLRAVEDRPNITGYVSCHTFGAVHLHPPLNDDDHVPEADARLFADLGARAAAFTGYQVMSFNDLKHVPYRVKGGQLAWFYHERGIPAWITEFWNPARAAGLEDVHPSRWLVDHPVEEAIRLIRWSDEELGGKGFVTWYPFDHPQLGHVELGGWDLINYWYNPPLDRVEREVAPHTDWVIMSALASPLLELRSVTTDTIRPGVHRLSVVVANTGWLPTNVTAKAVVRNQVGEVVLELDTPDDVQTTSGAKIVRVGQLAGRNDARTSTTWWGHDPGTPDLVSREWFLLAEAGTEVIVSASHARAGRVRRTVTLGEGGPPQPALGQGHLRSV